MLAQVLIGIAVISSTIVLQALLIYVAIGWLKRMGEWLMRPPFEFRAIVIQVFVVLWLIFGIGLSVAMWAGLFLCLGIFETFEPSFYFSIVTFTTLGYGDIILDSEWRLLAGLAAANGLIVFGLNTAFLIEFNSRLRQARNANGFSKD